jgi:myosin-18
MELELKEDKVASLARELDELTFGGKTEEEVAHLKKTKHEQDKKLKEQVNIRSPPSDLWPLINIISGS